MSEKLRCVSNAVWKDIRPFEVVKLYFDEKKRVSMAASTGVSVELNEVSFQGCSMSPHLCIAPGGRSSRRDPPLTGGHYLQDSRLGGQVWKRKRTLFFIQLRDRIP